MLATGSFYNKRLRSTSPLDARKRRRTVTNENSDPSRKTRSQSSAFDFHSSESSGDDKCVSVLSEKNMKGAKNRKSSLEIVKKPQRKSRASKKGKKTEKVDVKSDNEEDTVFSTPVNVKNKFFKSRSPASADKVVGNIVIKKGFDVKFYPKRQSDGKENQKSVKKVEKSKPKPKSVKSIPATQTAPFYTCDFFENDGVNNDKCASSGSGKQDNPIEISDSVEKSSVTKDNLSNAESDSGLCMSSANTEGDSIQPVSSYTPELFDGEDDSDTLSLIDTGSEDLFASSGRNTPEVNNVSSVSNTPKDNIVAPSDKVSPSSSENSENQTEISRSSNEETPTSVNLFPIFTRSQEHSSQKRNSRSSPRVSRSLNNSLNNSPLLKYVKSKDGLEQMTLGQALEETRKAESIMDIIHPDLGVALLSDYSPNFRHWTSARCGF